MAPAGSAEADGEKGQDPGVRFGVVAEGPEEERPDDDEEEDYEENDGVGGGVRAGPEVGPVAAVRG